MEYIVNGRGLIEVFTFMRCCYTSLDCSKRRNKGDSYFHPLSVVPQNNKSVAVRMFVLKELI